MTVLQLLMMTLESSMGQLLHPLAQDHCLATFHSLFPLSPSNKLLLYSPNNQQVPFPLFNQLFPHFPNNQQVPFPLFNQLFPHSPSNKLFPQKLLLAHQLSFHYHQFSNHLLMILLKCVTSTVPLKSCKEQV